MKKFTQSLLFTSIMFVSFLTVSAQSANNSNSLDMSPNAVQVQNHSAESGTIWDVLFSYDVRATTGSNGYAAVCFFNDEFWISRWQNDTISILDDSGILVNKVTIPGLTGIRSLTTDGTYLYAGNNTANIYQIDPDPLTPIVLSQFAAPVANVRSLTFDPNADGGLGGFWVSTWGTAITQVSKTGTFIKSISAATHGLTGMYGTAFDNYSQGGPYLWVFDQGYSATRCDLVQLNATTGVKTGVFHNILTDVGMALAPDSSLAGGVFVHSEPGLLVLMGVVQGVPNNILFGYDLDVTVGMSDIAASTTALNVFPSVSNSMINVNIKDLNNQFANIQIYDVTGKLVFDKNTDAPNNYININSYSNGVYLVKMIQGNKMETTRFVKN